MEVDIRSHINQLALRLAGDNWGSGERFTLAGGTSGPNGCHLGCRQGTAVDREFVNQTIETRFASTSTPNAHRNWRPLEIECRRSRSYGHAIFVNCEVGAVKSRGDVYPLICLYKWRNLVAVPDPDLHLAVGVDQPMVSACSIVTQDHQPVAIRWKSPHEYPAFD